MGILNCFSPIKGKYPQQMLQRKIIIDMCKHCQNTVNHASKNSNEKLDILWSVKQQLSTLTYEIEPSCFTTAFIEKNNLP